MEQKTLVLSALDGSNKKAVVNVEKREDGYTGSIRLYNFKETPRGILTLAFLFGNEVYKSALSEKSQSFYSFSLKTEKNADKFSCALVNILGGNATPLLLGASDGKVADNFSGALSKNFDLLDNTNLSAKTVAERLDLSGIDYDDDEKEELDEMIDREMCERDKCAHCNYRNAFYGGKEAGARVAANQSEQLNIFNDYRQKNTYTPPDVSEGTFYDEIKNQLALLFERYPEETFLNEIIPDSKWIKVDYEDNGQYFVIGLLYENDKVQYVCYGMPGQYSIEPPREFSGISQWLPLDPEKPEELGYWLMYQDANTGENIEIKIS